MNKVYEQFNGAAEIERCSRRIVHGVEIVERETVHTYKIDASAGRELLPSGTRLVISEAEPTEPIFIARRRSEIAGLDPLIDSLIRKAA